nr:vinorine synthase-like [Coffea arabica]
MAANLEILSIEMIKPSSPTPHHLRNHNISLLDQLAPPIYIPLIFFYQPSQLHTYKDHAQISQFLKRSLSNVLSKFYPLAGRISSNNVSIDCNDAGALFVEAQVHSNLLQVTEKPSTEDMKQYLPLELNGGGLPMNKANTLLLAVQSNLFDCGGLAISVQISHIIADGITSVTFINAWAASCREDAEIPQCSFDLASLFPPRDLANCDLTPTTGTKKIATKRFVFDKEKLGILKQAAAAAASPESQVNESTRVEAVSAFFWKHFVELSKSRADSKSHKIVAAANPVNLRPRMNPPLPDHAFGNLWIHALTTLTAEEDKGYSNLARVLSNTLRNIDSNYVEQLQSGDKHLGTLKKAAELLSKGELEVCITSWCRFPVYEVDYCENP